VPASGQWNGVVTLNTTLNDTSVPGNTTIGHEQLAFVVHGDRGTAAGGGYVRHTYSDSCGPQADTSSWSLGSAPVGLAVTVGDSGIEFRVTQGADVTYVFTAEGAVGISLENGGTDLCDGRRQPPEPTTSEFGDPGFDVNLAARRQYLLRTSGRFAATAGSGTSTASSGTLGGGVTTVTYNLIRTGPDRDHDGLADAGDPHPNRADSDGDGYPDGWEVDHGTSPTNGHSHPHAPYHVGAPDSDGDGWSDANEIRRGSDPDDRHNFPPGLPDSPPVLPISKPDQGKPPIERHQARWVHVPYTTTCSGGGFLTQSCTVILSPRSTAEMNARTASYTRPTEAEELQLCTKFRVIPDPKGCAGANLWSFVAQESFKIGLSTATGSGDCFFYEIFRHKLGSLWSSSDWESTYNQGDYEMRPMELRYFGTVEVRCADADASSIARFG
jgi:hypothetical protein